MQQFCDHRLKPQYACGKNNGIVACSYRPEETPNFSLADAPGLPDDEHFAQLRRDNDCSIAPKHIDIFGMPACREEAQAVEATLSAQGHRLANVFGQFQEERDAQPKESQGEVMHVCEPKLADAYGSFNEGGNFADKQLPCASCIAAYKGHLQSTAEASQATWQDGVSTCSTTFDEEAAYATSATSPSSGYVETRLEDGDCLVRHAAVEALAKVADKDNQTAVAIAAAIFAASGIAAIGCSGRSGGG